jgi:hypothetical protein
MSIFHKTISDIENKLIAIKDKFEKEFKRTGNVQFPTFFGPLYKKKIIPILKEHKKALSEEFIESNEISKLLKNYYEVLGECIIDCERAEKQPFEIRKKMIKLKEISIDLEQEIRKIRSTHKFLR